MAKTIVAVMEDLIASAQKDMERLKAQKSAGTQPDAEAVASLETMYRNNIQQLQHSIDRLKGKTVGEGEAELEYEDRFKGESD